MGNYHVFTAIMFSLQFSFLRFAGDLLPQAGIVIGLVLSIYEIEEFKEISGILLATIMGASVINELIGPLTAKYSLFKSGEIKR